MGGKENLAMAFCIYSTNCRQTQRWGGAHVVHVYKIFRSLVPHPRMEERGGGEGKEELGDVETAKVVHCQVTSMLEFTEGRGEGREKAQQRSTHHFSSCAPDRLRGGRREEKEKEQPVQNVPAKIHR